MSEKKFQEILENLKDSTTQIENVLKNSMTYAQDLLEICGTNINPESFCCCKEIQERLEEITTHLKEIRIHEDKLQESKCNTETTEVPKRNPNLTSLQLRKARTSSMKYLIQWEKVIEAQNAENNTIDEDLPLLPKPVIKKRVKQFEGSHKKRVSSTVEAFLDGPDRKTVLKEEDLLEEDEDEQEQENGKKDIENDIEKQEEAIYEKNQSNANDGDTYVTLYKDGINEENHNKLKPRIVGVIVSILLS